MYYIVQIFLEQDLKIQKLISGGGGRGRGGGVLITAGGSDFFVEKNKWGGPLIGDLRVGALKNFVNFTGTHLC